MQYVINLMVYCVTDLNAGFLHKHVMEDHHCSHSQAGRSQPVLQLMPINATQQQYSVTLSLSLNDVTPTSMAYDERIHLESIVVRMQLFTFNKLFLPYHFVLSEENVNSFSSSWPSKLTAVPRKRSHQWLSW